MVSTQPSRKEQADAQTVPTPERQPASLKNTPNQPNHEDLTGPQTVSTPEQQPTFSEETSSTSHHPQTSHRINPVPPIAPQHRVSAEG
ncbi:hypothetical protein PTTW11_10958 [Pyrenophora teres f. teres]|uniref:Uncharacterized protein n=1 Tax=Pyrenophora teres f. teres TaxID=97479 RepID=A0A6S6WKP9_9PLEO|nr:hypothetical protein PTTW11_10958 [Pyrenophora teres f. teres]